MTTTPSIWICPDWRTRAGWNTALVILLLMVFGGMLLEMVQRWTAEPQYSHGFVIPLMAVGLGLFRRSKITAGVARSDYTGMIFLACGVAAHLVARWFFVDLLDNVGFMSCVFGIALLVWGRRFVFAMWPAIGFLAFMFPLPYSVEQLFAAPLQVYGAEYAAWYIQMLGIPAVAQGSVIHMVDVQLGVEEACSGMRMLMVFVAISAATMILSRRTRWEKVLILVSAVPIAVACNVARIVATATAHHWMGSETADLIFHGLSGWLMMPAAMALLFLELRLLDWILVETQNPLARVPSSVRAPAVFPATDSSRS